MATTTTAQKPAEAEHQLTRHTAHNPTKRRARTPSKPQTRTSARSTSEGETWPETGTGSTQQGARSEGPGFLPKTWSDQPLTTISTCEPCVTQRPGVLPWQQDRGTNPSSQQPPTGKTPNTPKKREPTYNTPRRGPRAGGGAGTRAPAHAHARCAGHTHTRTHTRTTLDWWRHGHLANGRRKPSASLAAANPASVTSVTLDTT
jgi:hypothetical protein